MRTIFEWDGSHDIQPFQVGGNATTKTITTENTDKYVKTNAYSLRVYANDGANGKGITPSIYLPMPKETGIRFTMSFITSIALSEWVYWDWTFYRYDGTNLNQLGVRWNSNANTDLDTESYNDSGGWSDIVGGDLNIPAGYWWDCELIGNFNATAVAPTYSYLRTNGTEFTTFAADGDTAASGTIPNLLVLGNWTVQNGASAYMYVDKFKVEVF